MTNATDRVLPRDGAIRLGIVGIGKIARDQHVPAILANPRFALVGTADPHGSLAGVAAVGFSSSTASLASIAAVAISARYDGGVQTATASRSGTPAIIAARSG